LNELWAKLWTGSVLTITHSILDHFGWFMIIFDGYTHCVMGRGRHGYGWGYSTRYMWVYPCHCLVVATMKWWQPREQQQHLWFIGWYACPIDCFKSQEVTLSNGVEFGISPGVKVLSLIQTYAGTHRYEGNTTTMPLFTGCSVWGKLTGYEHT